MEMESGRDWCLAQPFAALHQSSRFVGYATEFTFVSVSSRRLITGIRDADPFSRFLALSSSPAERIRHARLFPSYKTSRSKGMSLGRKSQLLQHRHFTH